MTYAALVLGLWAVSFAVTVAVIVRTARRIPPSLYVPVRLGWGGEVLSRWPRFLAVSFWTGFTIFLTAAGGIMALNSNATPFPHSLLGWSALLAVVQPLNMIWLLNRRLAILRREGRNIR